MARTAKETACTLIRIYEDRFANESYNQFRVTWPELRAIAGVTKLNNDYLCEINQGLNKSNYTLISLENFLVVALEWDFTHIQTVPPSFLNSICLGMRLRAILCWMMTMITTGHGQREGRVHCGDL